jgi:hypothetical protein
VPGVCFGGTVGGWWRGANVREPYGARKPRYYLSGRVQMRRYGYVFCGLERWLLVSLESLIKWS